MTESSTIHLPPTCPVWCISDHPRDRGAEGFTVFHSSAVLFEIPTSDGPVPVTIERIDGTTDGSGGLRVNLDKFDVALDDLALVNAQLGMIELRSDRYRRTQAAAR